VTPDDLLALEEIRHVLSTYTMAGDRGRINELISAFADDGILEFGGTQHKGHAAIAAALTPAVADKRAALASTGNPPPFVRHNLTSCRIELRGSVDADGWTYFSVVTPIGLDHCGVYVDRFTKASGRWLLAHRRVKIDWRDPHSAMAPEPDRERAVP